MPTNLEIEQAIRARLTTYPAAAAADMRWLLTETTALREIAANEYKLRVAAEESGIRSLTAKTQLQVQVRQLDEKIEAQSAELADAAATIRKQGEEIAALHGQPDVVMVPAGSPQPASEGGDDG